MDEAINKAGGGTSILDSVLHQQQAHVSEMAIEDRLKQMLEILPERDREIIQSHFGLFGSPFATLEEIGSRFSITRERVRQIERSSIAELKKSNAYDRLIKPFEDGIVQILEESGGAMEERQLFAEVFGKNFNKLGNIPLFVFGELLTRAEVIDPDKIVQKGWRLKLSSWEFMENSLAAFEQTVKEVGKPMDQDSLMTAIKQSAFYSAHANQLADRVILSLVFLSRRIRMNPFGLWGMSDWNEIIPKRMSDKIYLAMKKVGKPMHFRDIARTINGFKFDQKVAHPATIHNELIVNKKYVLIGRGIYALREWGYEPGVVADVIVEILSEKGALSREQIVTEVFKKRQVKVATIHLALTNKSKFQKLPSGKYALIEGSV